ncbi:hypothetical protein EDB92DRAFT_1872931 [Lactarius akahatsu]|uniref:Uncharacterized protein n=1 Tax=Lactarius akahatsu TaxID=416441 RepID=A0AAD4LBY2_9AGAM|nr:hypothetical protein EDB92DRAFT_1872931 [Lactarius akahatsu]
MNGTTLYINDESVIQMNTRLEGTWLAGYQQYDTGVNTSISTLPRQLRWSSIQAQIPEGGESSDTPNDLNEYESGPVDERFDLEAASEELDPEDLDNPWPYTFQMGDSVWIRTEGGNWYSGKVSSKSVKRGPTRQGEGLFYPVIFRRRIRKHFAPLNGEIKPDTPRTRTLLRQAGWL